jgi:hypothetical protein
MRTFPCSVRPTRRPKIYARLLFELNNRQGGRPRGHSKTIKVPPAVRKFPQKRRTRFKTMRSDRCSRDCTAVDIQVIGRKAHPPTSLNGWVGCHDEVVCESSCLPDNLGFPRMQAVSVESQDRPHPTRRQINAGPYQQVLRGPQQKRQNRRRAHDREKLNHNVRALQPASHRMEQHFKLDFRCRCAHGPV